MSYYSDVITGAMASQITSLTIVYSTVYSDADQRKHQSSASLAFVREIAVDQWTASYAPVTRKMFPFHDVIMMWDIPRTLKDMLYVFHVPDTKATQVPQIAKFMGLTWGPPGPHAGLTNLAIRVVFIHGRRIRLSHIMNTMVADDWATQGAHQELC